MKKLLSILLVALVAITGTSCSNSKAIADIWNGYDQLLSNSVTAKLYAGNSEEVGTVIYGIEQVGNSGYITATYQLENGWVMSESQLFVGKSENMPVFDPENPKLNSSPFIDVHAPRVSSFVQYVPVNKLPKSNPGLCIVSKAIVRNADGQKKTALADNRNDMLSKL
jgi:hypothetical protein